MCRAHVQQHLTASNHATQRGINPPCHKQNKPTIARSPSNHATFTPTTSYPPLPCRGGTQHNARMRVQHSPRFQHRRHREVRFRFQTARLPGVRTWPSPSSPATRQPLPQPWDHGSTLARARGRLRISACAVSVAIGTAPVARPAAPALQAQRAWIRRAAAHAAARPLAGSSAARASPHAPWCQQWCLA